MVAFGASAPVIGTRVAVVRFGRTIIVAIGFAAILFAAIVVPVGLAPAPIGVMLQAMVTDVALCRIVTIVIGWVVALPSVPGGWIEPGDVVVGIKVGVSFAHLTTLLLQALFQIWLLCGRLLGMVIEGGSGERLMFRGSMSRIVTCHVFLLAEASATDKS